MEQILEIRSKRDSEFFAHKPSRDHIDLCDIADSVHPDQVCRTCKMDGQRLWPHSAREIASAVAKGTSVADLECAPDQPWGAFKVLDQTDWRGRIVPLDQVSNVSTRAEVQTCGQQLRNECAKCDRFQARSTKIAYTTNPDAKVHWIARKGVGGKVETVAVVSDGSAPRWWTVTVGGHCGIGVDGITVNGETKFCDFIPRKKRVENASCANCYYLDFKGEQWQSDYLEINANAALTPWEREQALEEDSEGNPAKALGFALWRKQSHPAGRRTIHVADILSKDFVPNSPARYTLVFKENLITAIIAADDERFLVNEYANGTKAYVEVLWPNHNILRLYPTNRRKVYIWPDYPSSLYQESDTSDLVNSNCVDCRQPTQSRSGHACYFHAKGPVIDTLSREIVFSTPGTMPGVRKVPANSILGFSGDSLTIVDGNGNKPVTYSDTVANVTVFKHHLSSLLRAARNKAGIEGYREVYGQYLEVFSGLRAYTKLRNFRPSWLRLSSIEPNKPTCSHPDGIDMRKAFQDSFGSERVDWEFDHGEMNTMIVDEEWRVGYRQHDQTPQHLQEEIMATDTAHPYYDAAVGAVIGVSSVKIQAGPMRTVDAIGGMYIDDRPVTDPAEFMDRLDEIIEVGEAGQVTRKMTRRQLLFGYELSRGYFGSRRGSEKTSIPAADPGFVIFDITDEPDQIDISDAWKCLDCETSYDVSELEDFFNPMCECGSRLYKDHIRSTSNPRARGGIGNAYAMDTAYTQQTRRLYSTVCEHWRLNASTHIGLAEVEGSNLTTEEMGKVKLETSAKIVKVGVLTEAQKASNMKYQESLDVVIVKRDNYQKDHPAVTSEELIRLFPAPAGDIYQAKIAGSLAKMGSV